MKRIAIVLLILALAGCEKPQRQPASEAAPAAQPGELTKGVDRTRKGTTPRDIAFNDPDGGEISLSDFRGTPVLVNLWASWCAPCVKELPTLDALARSHAIDGELGVIAVSQDNGPRASVAAFLDKLKIEELGAYQDAKMALAGGLGVEVMPTTLLLDAEGREVWRYVGDLDWTGPEAARLMAEAKPAGGKG